MEKIHLRKKFIRCGLIVASQLVIICGASALKTEKADAANKNLAISIANDYVNIRNKPSLQGKIKGRLYRGSAVTITKTYKNGWALIKSGSFRGYIKKEYLATGAEAQKLAKKYGVQYITVKKSVSSLNVREKSNKKAKVITQIASGESFYVKKCGKVWVRITIDGDIGYVAKDYVNLRVKYKRPVSITKILADEKKQQEAEKASSSTNSTAKNDTTTTDSDAAKGDTDKNKVTGSKIVKYAKKFLGCPYKYGGTSLTKGSDCSGFTQSIYKEFGYSIPRTSLEQSSYGTKVSSSSVQEGDLVFYKNGKKVGHVAIYIGDGEVIHSSNEKDGVKISKMNYRTPYCIRRIL
ncbi:MAG: C40 family peptidase [Clostridium sp.]|uniref:C40 family peptidase n=1 Tax=Butyribacter sp. TaxID=2822465 RepID=UPI002A9E7B77|nr:C40 family peptidase [Clostridium sp.]MDY5181545.1 C40 family peptidase [Butyribacter sp.]